MKDAMRTFVISDAHGYPGLIRGALDHGGFDPDVDAFVYAGDLLDRGPDPAGCVGLIERYATEVLLGNHELAVLLTFPIWPQDWASVGFRPLLIDRVLNAEPDRAWKVATCVDRVVVSHAGIGPRYQRVLDDDCRTDPWLLSAHLNAEFLAAVRRELETGEWDEGGILGDDGPLWWRPGLNGGSRPVAGILQVAGHTPPVPELEAVGFHMTDPCAWALTDGPGRCRYALIEDGRVSVEEGVCEPLRGGSQAIQIEVVSK